MRKTLKNFYLCPLSLPSISFPLSPSLYLCPKQLTVFQIYKTINFSDVLAGCKEQLTLTNSHTKALAIFPDSNKLIECTSLYQGRCRTRNLSNIGRVGEVRTSRAGLVANDAYSSTAIFVGVGPSTTYTSSSASIGAPSAALTSAESVGAIPALSVPLTSQVLYVASTYQPTAVGPRDALDVPAVSSLSLDAGRLFEFTSQSISSGTFMKLDYRRMPLFK